MYDLSFTEYKDILYNLLHMMADESISSDIKEEIAKEIANLFFIVRKSGNSII